MLKRFTTLLFLFLANFVLLGHAVVPHNHIVQSEGQIEHHHSEGHHDGNHHSDYGNDGDHELPFAHFAHSPLTFISGDDFGASHELQIVSNFILTEVNLPMTIVKAQIFHKPVSEASPASTAHSLSSGLRAPPVFIS